jgi:hypothetical protein
MSEGPPVVESQDSLGSLVGAFGNIGNSNAPPLTNEQLDELSKEVVAGIEDVQAAAAAQAAEKKKEQEGGGHDDDEAMEEDDDGAKDAADDDLLGMLDDRKKPDEATSAAGAAAFIASAGEVAAATSAPIDPQGPPTMAIVPSFDKTGENDEAGTISGENDDDDDDDNLTLGGRSGGKGKEPMALPKVTGKAQELFDKHQELFKQNGITSAASLDTGAQDKVNIKVVQDYIKGFSRGSSDDDSDEDENEPLDMSKYGLVASQEQESDDYAEESAEQKLRTELDDSSSLVVGRKVKEFKKKLVVAKEKLNSDSLAWQQPIKEYVKIQEPSEFEGKEIRKLTSVRAPTERYRSYPVLTRSFTKPICRFSSGPPRTTTASTSGRCCHVL